MKHLVICFLATVALHTACIAEESKKIQDNSFLIEEAYNQEAGVVQHIQSVLYDRNTKNYLYSFTQEWPCPDQTHQVSYTVPLARLNDPRASGPGDVLLNYRYQAVMTDRVAFAPRLSLILPTGDYRKGLGSGATGVQINMPLSVEVSDRFVTHVNAGATYTPRSRSASGARANAAGTSYGFSLVHLTSQSFNLMLEIVRSSNQMVEPDGSRSRQNITVVNPGFRFATDFDSGLQIVSGLSFPRSVGGSASATTRAALAYLSFEHPFK